MILVTGGFGFIGSHICRMLINNGREVVVLDKFKKDELNLIKKIRLPDISDIKYVSGDITDFPFVFEVLKEFEINEIIHTAAISFIPTAIKKPSLTFHVNTMGTFNLLEAGRILELEKFVYVSTSSVYGDFKYSPTDENHPLNPKDIYGATKLAADRIALSYNLTYNMPTTVVRPSSVYGPADLEKRVVKNFIENALRGIPLELHGGGTQRRDFTYVEDTARGINLALNSKRADGEAFNITGGKDYSIKDLARVIKGVIPGAEIIEASARSIDTKRGRLDISKANKLLGYKPRYDLKRGVREYIRWILEVYAPVIGLAIKNQPVIE